MGSLATLQIHMQLAVMLCVFRASINFCWIGSDSYKPVSELRSEICEAYVQCRRLAQRYGSQMAYHSYFANNQGRN
ncbi:hypothetical protein C0J45_22927 [Silurus meridionalis]|nr:hypothetical protein C0J45_22927 [Silurus meridionalis]